MIQMVDPAGIGGGQKRSMAPRFADLSRLKVGLLSKRQGQCRRALARDRRPLRARPRLLGDASCSTSATPVARHRRISWPSSPPESDFLITAVGD